MSAIPTQIERWEREEISSEQLLRDLIEHENWMFFVAPGGVKKAQLEAGVPDYILQHNEHGEKILFIFSDAEAIKSYIQQSGITEWRCEVMVASGRDIFSSLPDDLSSVTVNPASPPTVNYTGEPLKMLRHIADAAFMERELRSLSDGSIQDNATLYLKTCAAELPGRYRIEQLTGLRLAQVTLELNSPGILFNRHGYIAPLMLNAQFLKFVCDVP